MSYDMERHRRNTRTTRLREFNSKQKRTLEPARQQPDQYLEFECLGVLGDGLLHLLHGAADVGHVPLLLAQGVLQLQRLRSLLRYRLHTAKQKGSTKTVQPNPWFSPVAFGRP